MNPNELTKPREFWISKFGKQTYAYKDPGEIAPKDAIHVIEYRAYEKLLEENRRLLELSNMLRNCAVFAHYKGIDGMRYAVDMFDEFIDGLNPKGGWIGDFCIKRIHRFYKTSAKKL